MEADIDLPSATVLLHESRTGHERRAHMPPMLVVALANVPQIPGLPFFFYRNIEDLRPAWEGVIKRAYRV